MHHQSQSRLPEALYRAAQVRELDRRTIEDHAVPGYQLMTRAGRAAFQALGRRWSDARQIKVVCGGGNNGGDGYVIARLAREAGLEAEALYLKDPHQLSGDARTAWADARDGGVPVIPFDTAALDNADLIVDAVLGTGLERAVEGHYAQALAAINTAPTPVLAVDIPSGLHADTGTVLGVAVRAELTVTFIGLKVGLFTGQGPGYTGQIVFDDLEVPRAVYADLPPAATLYQGRDLSCLLPPRPRDAHKGHYGHVLVVGGDLGTAGAARMAAESAGRCGAGLISVATRPEHAALAALRPELMFHGVQGGDELAPLLDKATVIALGPGLGQGQWGKGLWQAVMAGDRPLVVDADGLNLLALEPRRRDDWVLTPHPGEAARLLGCSPRDIQADRLTAARQLVERYAGVVVLKGAGSLIQGPDGPPAIVNTGNPGMASGGMGDVLTGVIAALLAQGLTPWQAACSGAWLHGRAADLAAREGGERGLLALDLMPYLRSGVNP